MIDNKYSKLVRYISLRLNYLLLTWVLIKTMFIWVIRLLHIVFTKSINSTCSLHDANTKLFTTHLSFNASLRPSVGCALNFSFRGWLVQWALDTSDGYHDIIPTKTKFNWTLKLERLQIKLFCKTRGSVCTISLLMRFLLLIYEI